MANGLTHFTPPTGANHAVAFADTTALVTLKVLASQVPMLLLIGQHEKIYNPETTAARAKSLVPNVQAEIVPNASHDLNVAQSDYVNERILKFFVTDQR